MEVKRCKEEAAELEERLETQISSYEHMHALWNEFDSSLIKVSDVHLGVKKIAGVRVPLLENVDFEIRPYSLFNAPNVCRRHTFAQGVGTDGYRTGVYRRQTGLAGTCT